MEIKLRTNKGVNKMKNLTLLCFVVAALGAWSSTAGAESYWVTYEGNDLPENEGWNRQWGDDEVWQEGPGAIRTVANGVLTMDTMYDDRVYDYNILTRPGRYDPGEGEVFVAEWRLFVEDSYGDWPGASVDIVSDHGWTIWLGFYEDHITSHFEDDIPIAIMPGAFHEYRLYSWDMRHYNLYIDGEIVYQGLFWEGLLHSQFSWGDTVSGAASLAHWDYARYGVIPEPASLYVLGLTLMFVRNRRGYEI